MTEKFFKDWLSAWHGNNPLKLLEFYHEDSFYSDPANTAGLRGKAELSIYLGKLLKKYPEWVWELDSYYVAGEIYFVKWKAIINQNNVSGIDLVKFADGKIIHNEVYFDASVFLSGNKTATK